jgi:peptidoglycan/LPS O-acetylase OafA/YrhL
VRFGGRKGTIREGASSRMRFRTPYDPRRAGEMPEPIQRNQRYMPGLDGLRAFAVLAVIAYHLGFGWAPGGLLGVAVFFTLSGYLITDLLLGQWSGGRMRLGNFWLRRARRLLPALFVMLVVVVAWVTIADPARLDSLRGAVISSALYVNNWWLIDQHVSYFARFAPPSPLGHLWSLAVEEQFYLVWPWLLLLGLRLVRERRHPVEIRPRLAALTLALGAASAALMAVLYHPAFDSTRVYDGTDTRAFELLFGAALAMVWPSRGLIADITPGARRILDGLGVAGLIVIVLLIWRTNDYSPFLYQGGMVLLSLATVLVIAAVVHPASRLGPLLGCRPLRWIGVRSYGIYLWMFPIIVLTTPVVTQGVDLPRASLQVAASFAVAALSWRFVEQPIRHGALGRLWARVRAGALRPRALSPRVRLGGAAALVMLLVACIGLAGAPPAHLSFLSAQSPQQAAEATLSGGTIERTTRLVRVSGQSDAAPGAELRPVPVSSEPSNRTSCRSVVHIGDSTSEGLVSHDYLPNASDRIEARYAHVGVKTEHMEISGATSIVETLPGGTNAQEVAQRLIADGYRGCWVLALGTNDTADVYVGSSVDLETRIDRMMSILGDQPVLWVNVKSLVGGGPYAEPNMERWNSAVRAACSKYPNMRIFDWASVVKDSWFIPDGIHYTSPGYAERARLIAKALARAFPADPAAETSGCVVHL